MKPKSRKPPSRLREREGESKPAAETVNQLATASKPFDAVEKKLSFALDALFEAIEAYREGKR